MHAGQVRIARVVLAPRCQDHRLARAHGVGDGHGGVGGDARPGRDHLGRVPCPAHGGQGGAVVREERHGAGGGPQRFQTVRDDDVGHLLRRHRGGKIRGGALEARDLVARLQRAMIQPRIVERERHAVGHELEQVQVVVRELARRRRVHVHDAEQAALDE